VGRPIDDILVELQRCNAITVLVTPTYVKQFPTSDGDWLQYELLGAMQRGMYVVPLFLGVEPGSLFKPTASIRCCAGSPRYSGQVRAAVAAFEPDARRASRPRRRTSSASSRRTTPSSNQSAGRHRRHRK
jgi:hypothetical protein